jgi:hypothetical protein
LYGYEIHRSVDEDEFDHVTSVKRTTFYDLDVVASKTYSYYVIAYDLAGNHSKPSNIVKLEIPETWPATTR